MLDGTLIDLLARIFLHARIFLLARTFLSLARICPLLALIFLPRVTYRTCFKRVLLPVQRTRRRQRSRIAGGVCRLCAAGGTHYPLFELVCPHYVGATCSAGAGGLSASWALQAVEMHGIQCKRCKQ
jgi:hypothetical protein